MASSISSPLRGRLISTRRFSADCDVVQQKLHDRIQTIAENASADQIDRYRWAAYSFRMPYWDWAQGEQSGNVPEIFMTPTTMVTTPEGRTIEILNPLYKYEFKPVPSAGAFSGKVYDTYK
jgi:Common central domain of tyrosinase